LIILILRNFSSDLTNSFLHLNKKPLDSWVSDGLIQFYKV